MERWFSFGPMGTCRERAHERRLHRRQDDARREHRGGAFSPDGLRVVSWADEGRVLVWDAASGELLFDLRHDEPAGGATFDDAGSLWTWSGDTLHKWDIQTGSETFRRRARTTVASIYFGQDGAFAISMGNKGGVQIWDAANGDLLASYVGAHAEVSPDATRVAAWDEEPGGLALWSLDLDVASLAATADSLLPALRPLSRTDQCSAYLLDAECLVSSGLSERDLAVAVRR